MRKINQGHLIGMYAFYRGRNPLSGKVILASSVPPLILCECARLILLKHTWFVISLFPIYCLLTFLLISEPDSDGLQCLSPLFLQPNLFCPMDAVLLPDWSAVLALTLVTAPSPQSVPASVSQSYLRWALKDVYLSQLLKGLKFY